jgi:endonuclease YncB( thermonuclease family)
MKNLLRIALITMLLVSCSKALTDSPRRTASTATVISLPIITSTTSPIITPTQPPTSANTQTQAVTFTPTIASTPTGEYSFSKIAACLPEGASFHTGFVTDIIDGDTIIIRIENGDIFSVRYIGIDTPERDEPDFSDAYNANANLVLQKSVILIKDISETDPYDRLLRYVIVNNIFVNLELVRMGYAKAVTFPPDITCAEQFTAAEQEALASRTVLWEATQTPDSLSSQVMIVSVDKKVEYVDIQNMVNTDVDLAGWNLVSERGHQECYLSGILKAGEVLRIWSGSAQGDGFSCGYSNPIWNNSEPDAAVLYNAQGLEVSRK